MDMKYFSTKRHRTRLEIIESELLPDSFNNVTIGFFSDVLSNFEVLDKSIESLNKQNVDMVLFGGNLLKKDLNEENKLALIEDLKSIHAPLGKYAVLGERDLNTQAYEILEAANFRHLTMSGSEIHNMEDAAIHLVGLDTDQLTYEPKDNIFEILLSNDPLILEDLEEESFDLVLAGKHLGGQVKLPLLPPLMDHGKYYHKRYDEDESTYILSQGIGTYDFDMRFNTKPETIILVLRKTNSES